MRQRERILQNLEDLYREAFSRAEEAGDGARMERLDFDFQRDQLNLEVLLDLRDLLAEPDPTEEGGGVPSLLEKAKKLRGLTKLR